MIVLIDGATGRVSLQKADDVTRLSVQLHHCDHELAERTLADLGRLDEGHAWLSIAGLRELSPRRGDVGWVNDFENAMAYARSKGWTDSAGHVRAHINVP